MQHQFGWHCHYTVQHSATHHNTLHYIAIHCNTLQYTATQYNTLQHTAIALIYNTNTDDTVITHCNTPQHTATHRKKSQQTATHYYKLPLHQYAAWIQIQTANYMYICACVCIYINMCAYRYTRVYKCTHICIYTHIFIYVYHIHVYIYKWLRCGWVFFERTRILNGILFTTHFIDFFAVETKQFVGSSVNMILTRQTCGQRSSRSAESKRWALENYSSKRMCYMFLISKCRGGWPRSVHFLGTCEKRTAAICQNLIFSPGETLFFSEVSIYIYIYIYIYVYIYVFNFIYI